MILAANFINSSFLNLLKSMQIKIAVASGNPVKIEAVRDAFSECFTDEIVVESFLVSSDVSDQPLGNNETRKGAKNRVEKLIKQNANFDYYVGIEGGVSLVKGQMLAFAWMVVKNNEKTGVSRTSSFVLPPRVTELVLAGKELGEADDFVFNRKNSKQENGAVGLLTNDLIVRRSLYKQAIILALIPFLSPDLYPANK